ncbi:hypothetical protein N7465_011495 [Penicillium sp. CMV-2018d]|nr:hypothetical protein N7465_011495 [Penicillium sp. CMV-2018d]
MDSTKLYSPEAFLAQGRLTHDELQDKYGDSRKKTQKLPTLAVGDLNTNQVQDILHLKATQDGNELAHIPPIPTPAELQSVLRKVDAARSKSPLNEASIRWTLDLLLVYAHDLASSHRLEGGPIDTSNKNATIINLRGVEAAVAGYIGFQNASELRYLVCTWPVLQIWSIWHGEIGPRYKKDQFIVITTRM